MPVIAKIARAVRSGQRRVRAFHEVTFPLVRFECCEEIFYKGRFRDALVRKQFLF